jgi:hypothetical protein
MNYISFSCATKGIVISIPPNLKLDFSLIISTAASKTAFNYILIISG